MFSADDSFELSEEVSEDKTTLMLSAGTEQRITEHWVSSDFMILVHSHETRMLFKLVMIWLFLTAVCSCSSVIAYTDA